MIEIQNCHLQKMKLFNKYNRDQCEKCACVCLCVCEREREGQVVNINQFVAIYIDSTDFEI